MKNVMLDLETMSTKPNASIISIGAVAFDMDKDEFEQFYVGINLESCEQAGLHISAGTVKWWCEQSEAARCAVYSPDLESLTSGLKSFSDWLSKFDEPVIWGNGSDFDNVVLGNAYEAVGFETPWSYKQNRCFRTLKSCFKVELERLGIHHNALADAIHQMRHLKQINSVYNLNLE